MIEVNCNLFLKKLNYSEGVPSPRQRPGPEAEQAGASAAAVLLVPFFSYPVVVLVDRLEEPLDGVQTPIPQVLPHGLISGEGKMRVEYPPQVPHIGHRRVLSPWPSRIVIVIEERGDGDKTTKWEAA